MKTIRLPMPKIHALKALAFLIAFSLVADAEAKRKVRKGFPRPSPMGEKVCADFNAGPAEALLGSGVIIVPGRYSTCTFIRRVDDAAAREKAYADATQTTMAERMKAMQKRQRYNQLKGSPPTDRLSAARKKADLERDAFKPPRPVLYDTVSVTHLEDALTIAAAILSMESIQKTTAEYQNVNTAGVDEAFYDVNHRILTARKGARVISIEVRIEGKSDKETRELSVTLAQEWLM